MTAGTECARIGDLIDRTIDDSATRRERRTLSRHIRHCPSCRSRYRSRRDQTRLLGSLVPSALVGAQVLDVRPPDPGFAIQWWERVTGSAGARMGQAMQVMMDVPAIATTKAGAGAIAVAAAGAIGAPVVIDTVRAEPSPPPVATVQTRSGGGEAAARVPGDPREIRPTLRPLGARPGSPTTPLRAARSTRRTQVTSAAAASGATQTSRAAGSTAAATSSASLEFGP